jgi:hypothetical protein
MPMTSRVQVERVGSLKGLNNFLCECVYLSSCVVWGVEPGRSRVWDVGVQAFSGR